MTRTLLCTSLCMSLATGAALAAAPQDRTAPARPATPPTAPARPAAPPAAPAATPPAGAVPQMDEKTAKEMAAWATAMMPGLEHQKLAARSGTWDLDMKMWMAPGMPPMESKGEAVCEMVLGGRFLREVVKSEFMGSPFEGIGYLAPLPPGEVGGYCRRVRGANRNWTPGEVGGYCRRVRVPSIIGLGERRRLDTKPTVEGRCRRSRSSIDSDRTLIRPPATFSRCCGRRAARGDRRLLRRVQGPSHRVVVVEEALLAETGVLVERQVATHPVVRGTDSNVVA
jgi:hypothetical protein